MADTVLRTAPAARYTRRHRISGPTARSNLQSVLRRKQARRLPVQDSPASQPPLIETPSAKDIAGAAIEACARALEAWAEFSQRADLLHNAAATLRKASGAIADEAVKPIG